MGISKKTLENAAKQKNIVANISQEQMQKFAAIFTAKANDNALNPQEQADARKVADFFTTKLPSHISAINNLNYDVLSTQNDTNIINAYSNLKKDFDGISATLYSFREKNNFADVKEISPIINYTNKINDLLNCFDYMEMESQVDTVIKNKTKLGDVIVDLDNNYSKHNDTFNYDDSTKELEEATTALNNAKKEISDFVSVQKPLYEKKVDEAQSKIDEYNKDNTEITAQIDQLNKDIVNNDKRINDLKTKAESLAKVKQEAKDAREEFNKAKANYQAALADIDKFDEQEQKNLDDAQKKVDDARAAETIAATNLQNAQDALNNENDAELIEAQKKVEDAREAQIMAAEMVQRAAEELNNTNNEELAEAGKNIDVARAEVEKALKDIAIKEKDYDDAEKNLIETFDKRINKLSNEHKAFADYRDARDLEVRWRITQELFKAYVEKDSEVSIEDIKRIWKGQKNEAEIEELFSDVSESKLDSIAKEVENKHDLAHKAASSRETYRYGKLYKEAKANVEKYKQPPTEEELKGLDLRAVESLKAKRAQLYQLALQDVNEYRKYIKKHNLKNISHLDDIEKSVTEKLYNIYSKNNILKNQKKAIIDAKNAHKEADEKAKQAVWAFNNLEAEINTLKEQKMIGTKNAQIEADNKAKQAASDYERLKAEIKKLKEQKVLDAQNALKDADEKVKNAASDYDNLKAEIKKLKEQKALDAKKVLSEADKKDKEAVSKFENLEADIIKSLDPEAKKLEKAEELKKHIDNFKQQNGNNYFATIEEKIKNENTNIKENINSLQDKIKENNKNIETEKETIAKYAKENFEKKLNDLYAKEYNANNVKEKAGRKVELLNDVYGKYQDYYQAGKNLDDKFDNTKKNIADKIVQFYRDADKCMNTNHHNSTEYTTMLEALEKIGGVKFSDYSKNKEGLESTIFENVMMSNRNTLSSGLDTLSLRSRDYITAKHNEIRLFVKPSRQRVYRFEYAERMETFGKNQKELLASHRDNGNNIIDEDAPINNANDVYDTIISERATFGQMSDDAPTNVQNFYSSDYANANIAGNFMKGRMDSLKNRIDTMLSDLDEERSSLKDQNKITENIQKSLYLLDLKDKLYKDNTPVTQRHISIGSAIDNVNNSGYPKLDAYKDASEYIKNNIKKNVRNTTIKAIYDTYLMNKEVLRQTEKTMSTFKKNELQNNKQEQKAAAM
ncbi:MAG: hypothetical protein E7301_11505 [Butyrivibrio sp.]|nr:hypothetical protein [Butyrivibrio sp.]